MRSLPVSSLQVADVAGEGFGVSMSITSTVPVPDFVITSLGDDNGGVGIARLVDGRL